MILALPARAKLNLTLAVTGVRTDRFHEVDTVLQAIDLHDLLEAEPAAETSLEVEGDAPKGPDNLVLKAHAALEQIAGRLLPTRFRLHKRIPAGAGLGGGSSDAATGLRLAAADSRLGHLDEERLDRILATVSELANDLDAHDDVQPTDVEADSGHSNLGALVAIEQAGEEVTAAPAVLKSPRSVLCIPGSSKLDEAAALILAQLLRRRGFGAAAEQADALSMSRFFSLELADTSLVCICYVERPSSAKVQYAARRLGKKKPGVRIILALLGTEIGTPPESAGSDVAEGPFSTALEAVGAAAPALSHGAFELHPVPLQAVDR